MDAAIAAAGEVAVASRQVADRLVDGADRSGEILVNDGGCTLSTDDRHRLDRHGVADYVER